MYRKVIRDSKPFGAVEAKVVSVSCNGFIAVVQTVETIVPGTELKAAPKKNAPVTKAKVFELVLKFVVTYASSHPYIFVHSQSLRFYHHVEVHYAMRLWSIQYHLH